MIPVASFLYLSSWLHEDQNRTYYVAKMMENCKLGHPYRAGLATFLTCLMPVNRVSISEEIIASESSKCGVQSAFVWMLCP